VTITWDILFKKMFYRCLWLKGTPSPEVKFPMHGAGSGAKKSDNK
jgi:hypothetical protein